MYVFDTSPLVVLFKHYYPDLFPTLWKNFETLKQEEKIISVRECGNEIKSYADSDRLVEWAKQNPGFFAKPGAEELLVVTDIFKNLHFQNMIRKKERLQGKPVADPFVAAKAKVMGGCVVTQERRKENSAQLPNVCDHLEIPCVNLEEFMKKENWLF